jgi:hypothetical protein
MILLTLPNFSRKYHYIHDAKKKASVEINDNPILQDTGQICEIY